ncbi:MAG: UDP-galactopyranose mutase [Blastocatellia bacterium]|jgi:UDP-galactopyranose mutase|nr:UDP-galactopyranose mutase [Blastocatellia bacterium]
MSRIKKQNEVKSNVKASARVVSMDTQRASKQDSSTRKDEMNRMSELESWMDALPVAPDLVCLSHLRWDFVYQRPQHLFSRCATERRVFFIEEPVYDNGPIHMDVSKREDGLHVVVPHLTHEVADVARDAVMQGLMDRLFKDYRIREHILWYYTPMAMSFTRHLNPVAVVYDCMDELSAFKGAPPALRFHEAELFNRADLVFTGGQSLYEHKRKQHRSVHAFPSSIDARHFAQARRITEDPVDQKDIPHPRMGFFGVIDERLDIDLIKGLAEARPDWHLVIIGPVVKINEADLPRRENIHYLGGKSYKELPAYLAGWDVALLTFARNESTRFISPTKTPEYLAAGKPVVSTSIRDVVRPYEKLGLVRIADTVEEFESAMEAAMKDDLQEHVRRVDAFLAQTSWDRTWAEMRELIEEAVTAGRSSQSTAQAATAVAAAASGNRVAVRS